MNRGTERLAHTFACIHRVVVSLSVQPVQCTGGGVRGEGEPGKKERAKPLFPSETTTTTKLQKKNPVGLFESERKNSKKEDWNIMDVTTGCMRHREIMEHVNRVSKACFWRRSQKIDLYCRGQTVSNRKNGVARP